jgi:hypothetical protein
MQRIVNIACTTCTEAINTQYREEKGVVVAVGGCSEWLLMLEFVVVVVGEGDSCVKKDQSAAAEVHIRGTVE